MLCSTTSYSLFGSSTGFGILLVDKLSFCIWLITWWPYRWHCWWPWPCRWPCWWDCWWPYWRQCWIWGILVGIIHLIHVHLPQAVKLVAVLRLEHATLYEDRNLDHRYHCCLNRRDHDLWSLDGVDLFSQGSWLSPYLFQQQQDWDDGSGFTSRSWSLCQGLSCSTQCWSYQIVVETWAKLRCWQLTGLDLDASELMWAISGQLI